MAKKDIGESKGQNKSPIITELEYFRNQLVQYYLYRRKVINAKENLSGEELVDAQRLNEEIGLKAGKYGDLIADVTGIEPVISTSSGPSNIWTCALSYSSNKLVVDALDQLVQETSLTIGNIQRDIDLGMRDEETGKLTSPLGKSKFEVPKAFISHGKESVALRKLEEFLHNLGVISSVVKEQPSLDKTVSDKVEYYLQQADFVIILATGDDEFEGKLHPRQNVIHEIGLAQKTHPGKIIYLLEEKAEFPSNITPKVWERFKQRNMLGAFLCILRELRALGIILAIKPQIKE